MQGMQLQSLGREALLEEEMATPSSIHAWKISWTRAWWVQYMGVAESDMTEQLATNRHVSSISALSIFFSSLS